MCKGNKLTLPACGFTAPSGRDFDKWSLGAPGDKVAITANTTVKAIWKYCPSKPYTDVDTSQWYHYDVDYVIENGIMNGYDASTFGPNDPTTRAMMITILYRMAGEPKVTGSSAFTDVPNGQWYSNAIKWGSDTGIARGYGDGTFGPNNHVTREQLSAFLRRYAQYIKLDSSASGSLNVFTDANKVSSWFIDDMKWAVGHGIVNGTSATTLSPQAEATRAQIAAMVHRFKTNIG